MSSFLTLLSEDQFGQLVFLKLSRGPVGNTGFEGQEGEGRARGGEEARRMEMCSEKERDQEGS